MSGRPPAYGGRNAQLAALGAAIIGSAAAAASSGDTAILDELLPHAGRLAVDLDDGDLDEKETSLDEDGLHHRDYDVDVRDDR